ncbi:hypothetical protein JCM10207_006063 [Rhodosporidiobolus poonsookiae]
MDTLQLQTSDLAHSKHDFSILPSPSQFFGSSNASGFAHDYSAYAYDLPEALHDAPSPSESVPSLVDGINDTSPRSSLSPSASWSDRASSPASSLHSTPSGSPAMDKAVVVVSGDAADAYSTFDQTSPHLFSFDKALGGSPTSFAALGCEDANSALASSPCAARNTGDMNAHQGIFTAQPQHQAQSQSQSVQGYYSHQLPSPAASAASVTQQQQQQQQQLYAAPPQQQQQYYSSNYDQQQQQPLVYQQAPAPVQYVQANGVAMPASSGPVVHQLVSINGMTYAVAMPVAAAPQPTAVETAQGTFYFVPTVPASVQPQQQSVLATSTGESYALASGLPAPVAASIPGLAPLAVSPSPPAVSAPAPAPVVTSSVVPNVVPTPIHPEQKIRLPVGQGKRGSTKRAPKKDQVKRFVCPHPGCGRGFARNFNMQSHYKSHLGIREFTCPHCPKRFSRRHDRARHCSAVHDTHVDRDGNINGTGSASHSPSSSHDYDLEHDGEHDELEFDDGGHGAAYSFDVNPLAIGTSAGVF